MDTKTALLNSAEGAARRLGFDEFSYAYLAEEVGIRKASIHHHYTIKATLTVVLMQLYYADFEKACWNIETAETSSSGRLLALVNAIIALWTVATVFVYVCRFQPAGKACRRMS